MSEQKQSILIFADGALTEARLCQFLAQRDLLNAGVRILLTETGEISRVLQQKGVQFEVLNRPKLVLSGEFWKDLLVRARFFSDVLFYHRKVCRYYTLYPFQAVHAVGFFCQWLSIVLKVKFDATLIWQPESSLPTGFKFLAFRMLFSIFCDRLFVTKTVLAHPMGRSAHWRGRVVVLREECEPGLYGAAVLKAYKELEAAA